MGKLASYTLTLFKKDCEIRKIRKTSPRKGDWSKITESAIKEFEPDITANGWVTTWKGVWILVELNKKPLVMITYRPSFNYQAFTILKEIEQEVRIVAPGFKSNPPRWNTSCRF